MSSSDGHFEWILRGKKPRETLFSLSVEAGSGWMTRRTLASGIDIAMADFNLKHRALVPFQREKPSVGISVYLSGAVQCRFFAPHESVSISGGDIGIFCLDPQNGAGETEPGRVALVELQVSRRFLRRMNEKARGLLMETGNRLRVKPVTPGVALIARDLFYSPFMGTVRELFQEAKALELFAHAIQAQQDESSSDAPLIYAARDRMVREMADPQSLAELARDAGLSRTRFATRFRELFGKPPFAYLKDRRLETAHGMLKDRDVNVTETAFSVGYNSLSHFARAFRKRYGVAPLEIIVKP